MSEVLDKLWPICRQMVQKHGDDIPAATEQFKAAALNLPDFDKFRDALIDYAFQQMVYAERHRHNYELRRGKGEYDATPKTNGFTPDVLKTYRSLYTYMIGARTLGSLRPSEIPDLVTQERAVIAGHQFNVKLLESVQRLCKNDRPVREQVSERQLQKLFKKCERAEKEVMV